jgi:hypothetical protein
LELIVLFSFTVLFSHGCNPDMMLDEVSLPLECYCSSLAFICIHLFRAFPMQLATTAPQTSSFKSLLSRMRFGVEVVTVGGGLPDFLGASSSDRPFSAPLVSVSMSVVLRGAKKLQVNAAFGAA